MPAGHYEVGLEVGGQQPKGREHARMGRHDDLGDAEEIGQGRRVEPTRPTEGQEGEVAWIRPIAVTRRLTNSTEAPGKLWVYNRRCFS